MDGSSLANTLITAVIVIGLIIFAAWQFKKALVEAGKEIDKERKNGENHCNN